MPPVRWKSISPDTSDWFIVAMSPTSLAPLKTRLAASVNLATSSSECALEGVEARDAAEAEDIPVIGFENAVFLVIGRIVPQIPALVLGAWRG